MSKEKLTEKGKGYAPDMALAQPCEMKERERQHNGEGRRRDGDVQQSAERHSAEEEKGLATSERLGKGEGKKKGCKTGKATKSVGGGEEVFINQRKGKRVSRQVPKK